MLLTRYAPLRRSPSMSIATHHAAPRLACVKPAASVHPEPGSNSSLYISLYKFLSLFLTELLKKVLTRYIFLPYTLAVVVMLFYSKNLFYHPFRSNFFSETGCKDMVLFFIHQILFEKIFKLFYNYLIFREKIFK